MPTSPDTAHHARTDTRQVGQPHITIQLEASKVLNYASVVNKIPVINRLDLKNTGDSVLRDLVVKVESSPALVHTSFFNIEQISPEEHYVLETFDLQVDHTALSDLNEAKPVTLLIRIFCGEEQIDECEHAMEAVSYEQWPGDRLLPQLLAAFSQPNTKATARIQKAAAQLLRPKGKQLNGYQADSRSDVAIQVSAVYSAIAALDLDYANPPAGLIEKGQRIRTPARVVEDGLATCLDTVMLMASVLESVGLHPVLLLAHEHAWLACWLTDDALHETCAGDAQVVRKRLTSGELIAIETTFLCGANRARFNAAIERGADRLDPEQYDDFGYAIDVARARHQKIEPLPAAGEAVEEPNTEQNAGVAELDDELPFIPDTDAVTQADVHADAHQTATRIEQWKSQLLDFSMRNRLLNCDPGKHTFRISHPKPETVEDELAAGKKLTIDSMMVHAVADDPRNEDLLPSRLDRTYQQEIAQHAFERKRLVGLHDKDQTRKLLTKLYRDARSNEEETGSNTLYLCIGTLSWRPGGKSRDYMAPLLMLPIRLKRKSVEADFRLAIHDDDPILNPTLLQVLHEQFAIEVPGIDSPHALPSDESGIDVPRLLGLVSHAVTEQPHMEVRPDIIQIGNFSFAKYLLWKDLAHQTKSLLKHPLVETMVEGSGEAAAKLSTGDFIEQRQLDETVDIGELSLVTKADASQITAIHQAAQGRSFVCEGPPGTGKSETIANIIADQLRRQRRVLFVSEKKEALDVVHSRLREVGLEPFLMVLHAARASKKGVIEQYRQAIEAADARYPQDWEELRTQLRKHRDELNAYVNMLHTPHSAGLTVHQAITILAQHPDWEPAPLSWPSLESVDESHRQQLAESVRALSTLANDSGGVRNHVLAGIHSTRFTPSWRDDLLQKADDYVTAFDAMHPQFVELASELAVPGLQWTPADYDRMAGLFRALIDPPNIPSAIGNADSLQDVDETLNEVLTAVGQRRDKAQALAENWIDDALQIDAKDFKLRWRSAMGRIWPFSWFAKFGLRGQLKPYTKNGKRPRAKVVLPVLEQIAAVQQADASLEALRDRAQQAIDQLYRGTETDDTLLAQIRDFLVRLDTALTPLVSAETERWGELQSLLQTVAERPDELASTGATGRRLQDSLTSKATHGSSLNAVCEAASRNVQDAVPPDDPHALDTWANHVRGWHAVSGYLRAWCIWRAERDKAMAAGLGPLVAALETQAIEPSEFEAYFEFSFAHWWMNQMVEQTPLLQKFSRPLHEQTIAEFRDLDARFMQATRDQIFATLAANVPRPDVNIPGSPMGFLHDQLHRQRGHKPVRQIMQRLGDQNQALKPCMMMSPLTVAQYLEIADMRFDVVVFDEASQIRTCEAIGVIARAPQTIVVGDSKQLPPTSFFATGSQNDDGDYEDHESILEECAAVLPSHRLRWHYRSRNEELIAFSNDRYYDGDLISMPAPTREKAVTLHRVDGIYDRGRSRINRVEADAIIEFIKDRTLSPGTRRQSVGVVTFSAAQQALILNLLEDAAGKNHALEQAIKGAYNDDGKELFVKNLESVQGDQRDVIVFSICYGKTANGAVYNEFGPVNKPGGQRRLNVAVTRAADEVHVFSSMDPEDIKPAYLQAAESGVGDLKRYLMFARDGVSALETYSSPTGQAPDSAFEEQVMRHLVEKGWEVHVQVGVSKFRIDLAIVDPRQAGRYLAGIECDGATYHSSATARDRDIVRQEVLERLGWRLLRIWSTDWWADASAETDRIHNALLELLEEQITSRYETDAEFTPVSAATGRVHVDSGDGESNQPTRAVDTGEAEPVGDMSPNEAHSEMRLRARAEGEQVHQEYPAYEPPVVPNASGDLYDYQSRRRAISVAEEILEQAAPMRGDRLYRAVIGAFGHGKLTNKARRTLDDYFSNLAQTTNPDGPVFWSSREQADNYTTFRAGQSREIHDIPLVELSNFANELLSNAMRCPYVELCRTMTQTLGTRRMGSEVQNRLESALALLVQQERAEWVGDDQIRHLVQTVQ